MKTILLPATMQNNFNSGNHQKVRNFVQYFASNTKTNGYSSGIKWYSICLLLLMFLMDASAWGQITQPKAWTKAYDQTAATATGTSFAISPGSNRILVVAITNSLSSSGASADPTVITYGGAALAQATTNGGSTGRMHTWIYYLKDNAVMDNTSKQLNVTISGTNLLNLTVWYAVYDGVDQAPSSYTTGTGLSNASGSGPAQLSAAMAVNANQQAIFVSNIYNDSNTTIPTYTINSNWSSAGNSSGSSTGSAVAWKTEIANRTKPSTNTTDNAATSALAPAGSIRWAISAMSLPVVPTPTITSFSPTSACSGSQTSVIITGTNFTGATAVNFYNSQSASFTVNSATQITATLPSGASTGQISVSKSSGTGTSVSSFTVNPLPVSSVTGQSDISCFTGNDGTITILASGGTSPYSYSVDGGTSFTASGTNPFPFGNLIANHAYRIKVQDSHGCISK